VEIELPSGTKIQARRPGPLQFANWERLPRTFKFAGGGEVASVTEQEAEELAAFMRELLIYCCVMPRVSQAAAPDAEDEIRPQDVPEEDWKFILQWAMRLREAAAMQPFRRERANDGAGCDGENVLVQTVGSPGDQGPGAGVGDRPGGSAAGMGTGQRRG